MGICIVCGKYAIVDYVGRCSDCLNATTNRWGEPVRVPEYMNEENK